MTVSMFRIISGIGAFRDVTKAELIGKSRSYSVVWARHEACFAARILSRQSFAAIGARLGGRDPTTIMHSEQTVKARIAADPDYAAEISALLSILKRVADATETALLARAHRAIAAPASVTPEDVRALALGVVATNGVLGDAGVADDDARHAACHLMSEFAGPQHAMPDQFHNL